MGRLSRVLADDTSGKISLVMLPVPDWDHSRFQSFRIAAQVSLYAKSLDGRKGASSVGRV